MKAYWLSLPRSSGLLQAHLQQVESSVQAGLSKQCRGTWERWPGGGSRPDPHTPLLLLFQSQGRPGDEFPGVVPSELRGSPQRVVVAVIQDDEDTSAGKGIVPRDVNCIGVVNVHVVPMQHELHKQGFSLCPRNKQAVREIAGLLQEKAKKDESNADNRPDVKGNESSEPKRNKTHLVELLLLPQSGGKFQKHLESIGADVRQELEKSFEVQFESWAPGQKEGDSAVLIVFQSQGRPGDEFPAAVPQELRGGQQRVLLAVVQDDEDTRCGRAIVPQGVQLIEVVNLHVVPGQHGLHALGLCPRNKGTIAEISASLGLQKRSFFSRRNEPKTGERVYIHSLLANSSCELQEHHEAIKDSLVRNLEYRELTVVKEADPAPVLLFLCTPQQTAGETLKNELQRLRPGTLSTNTILVLVQKGQTEDRGRRKTDFTPGFEALLTVEPPSYQLEKGDKNGMPLHDIATFVRNA